MQPAKGTDDERIALVFNLDAWQNTYVVRTATTMSEQKDSCYNVTITHIRV